MNRIDFPAARACSTKWKYFGGFGQRKRGGRFVEDDEIGLVVDGAGDRHALALAALRVVRRWNWARILSR